MKSLDVDFNYYLKEGSKMSKILVTPSSFGKFSSLPDQILADAGLEVVKYSKPGMSEDELIEVLRDCDAVILGLEPMTSKVMDACPKLRVIARYGVGMDNVDLEAAKARGIACYNTPGANADAVADYSFGMILDLARCISVANRDIKAKNIGKYTGYGINGKTLGIVGLGAIGKCMTRRAKGFGMRVIAFDVYYDEAFCQEYSVEKVTLEQIFRESDFISLHCGLNENTRNMISMNELKQMKKTCFLINNARGGLVNEKDLYEALKNGVIAGAGIDAFQIEPAVDSPLLTLDNVIGAPHIAGSSQESVNNMGIISARKAVEGLSQKENR